MIKVSLFQWIVGEVFSYEIEIKPSKYKRVVESGKHFFYIYILDIFGVGGGCYKRKGGIQRGKLETLRISIKCSAAAG